MSLYAFKSESGRYLTFSDEDSEREYILTDSVSNAIFGFDIDFMEKEIPDMEEVVKESLTLTEIIVMEKKNFEELIRIYQQKRAT